MKLSEFTEAANRRRKRERIFLLAAGWSCAAYLILLAGFAARLRAETLAMLLLTPAVLFLLLSFFLRRRSLQQFRCPECGRPFPARLRQVTATHRCPSCGESVLEPDGEPGELPERLDLRCGKRLPPLLFFAVSALVLLFLASRTEVREGDAGNLLLLCGIALGALLAPFTFLRGIRPFPLICPECGGELDLMLLRHTARCSECGRQLCVFHRNPRPPELPPEPAYRRVLRENRRSASAAALLLTGLTALALLLIPYVRIPFLLLPPALLALLVLSTAAALNSRRLRAIGAPLRCPFCGVPLRAGRARCVFCGERPYREEK
ncbi:MAG: hypothetical protein HPZ91_13350 [Lentisphaeria bacterium]|nr:hypothetical protein [Lentisphaeria bacterium]